MTVCETVIQVSLLAGRGFPQRPLDDRLLDRQSRLATDHRLWMTVS